MITYMHDTIDPLTRRLLSHRQMADRFGISVRTLDRWILKRVVPEPIRINKHKYHPVDVLPRTDDKV
jgi:hypothetical protein